MTAMVNLPLSTTDQVTVVATVGDLPTVGVLEGALRYVDDVDLLYRYDGSAWAAVGVGASLSKYVKVFNATSDWTGPAGGFYTLSLLAATHGMGTNPFVDLKELDGSEYVSAGVEVNVDTTTGDILLAVSDSPDSRFAGRLIVI